MNYQLTVTVRSQGLYDITHKVVEKVAEARITQGLATIFIQHTSASLLIQENADPKVLRDLENWMNRLVPEGDELYTHTQEGLDDMPAHIKSALTASSLSIPVVEGRLALGIWQGIMLWEHRHHRGVRDIVVSVIDAGLQA